MSRDGLNASCKVCIKIRKRLYRENNKEKIAIGREKHYYENRGDILNKHKDYYIDNSERIKCKNNTYYHENKDKINKQNKSLSSLPCSSVKRLKSIPSIDNPKIVNGLISVECKTCNNHFFPTLSQISHRTTAVNGSSRGEANFYCSDICKQSCLVFGFITGKSIDPRSSQYVPLSEQRQVRQCQTNHLKDLQCAEKGYTYCERCGDIIDVELHHTLPVVEYGDKAVNSSGHMLLCVGCHVELHKECG